jgi:single-stranded-DNA-specific exonuclease
MSSLNNLQESIKNILLKNGVPPEISNEALEIVRKIYKEFSEEEIFFSLSPSISSISSPYIFPEMEKSVIRLIKAIKRNENILIFGDKDADGIIGTFILKDFFERLKKILSSSSEIYFRVPEEDEDYGILPQHIDEFLGKISLIVTVDNGISATEAVKKAKENGIDVIITDHHEYHDTEITKWAFSIIDPKKDKVGKEYLSGSGVAFYLILGVILYLHYRNLELWYLKEGKENSNLARLRNFVSEEYNITEVKSKNTKINLLLRDLNEKVIIERNINDAKKIIEKLIFVSDIYRHFTNRSKDFSKLLEEFELPPSFPNAIEKVLFSIHLKYDSKIYKFVNLYSPLVGLTVLSDNMPIVAENKFFVLSTLSKITKSEFESIKYLLSSLSSDDKVKIFDLIMKVIPFLNAPGRMGKAKMMLEFLMETDINKLHQIFSAIEELNKEKIRIVNELVSKLISKVDEVVIIEENANKGIISLLSTRLSNYTNKPVIVIGEGGDDGKMVGSARFKRGNVFSLLKEVEHFFSNFGGHKKAVGFVIEKTKLEEFVSLIKNRNFENYSEKPEALVRIPIKDFYDKFGKLIKLLEPLNPDMKPIFESYEVIKNYIAYEKIKYVLIENYKVLCEVPEEKIRNNLNKRVRIVYSYDYRFDQDIQEEVIYPKILEIENE